MTDTNFDVQAGVPFACQVRIVAGTNVWTDSDDFEARMQIRAGQTDTSELLYDFTPHLTKDVDGGDLLVAWNLGGAETRQMRSGYYDLFVSDPGAEDARALQLIAGYILMQGAVTSAEDQA